MPKLNIKDLPPDVRAEVRKKVGRKAAATREQVLRVASLIMQAATSSGEDIQTQRKGMELALKWLKTR